MWEANNSRGLLFVFGILSVSLSSIQVALAVQPVLQSGQSLITFARVSRGFAVFTLIRVALVALFLCAR